MITTVLQLITSNWKLVVFGVLLASNALVYNLWQAEKKEYAQYAAGVVAVTQQAIADKERVEGEQSDNLKKVKEYERNLPKVRADAVDKYLARRVQPNVSTHPMPGITQGKSTNDGACKELVPDTTFIQDAADDANKVTQWQEWALRNKVPLE